MPVGFSWHMHRGRISRSGFEQGTEERPAVEEASPVCGTVVLSLLEAEPIKLYAGSRQGMTPSW